MAEVSKKRVERDTTTLLFKTPASDSISLALQPLDETRWGGGGWGADSEQE
jgi:hypothetical protein